jgi:hypothetical protein
VARTPNEKPPREAQPLSWLQEAILRDFPNPERTGCPGTAVIRDIAKRSVRLEIVEGADWDHIMRCSPCYREFLDINDKLRTEAQEP